jgi:hypothetical protein
MQSSTCAVELLTIFKLLCGFADAHLSKIFLHVNAGTDNGLRVRPPYCDFQISISWWA